MEKINIRIRYDIRYTDILVNRYMDTYDFKDDKSSILYMYGNYTLVMSTKVQLQSTIYN